jgi:hypothetical protein
MYIDFGLPKVVLPTSAYHCLCHFLSLFFVAFFLVNFWRCWRRSEVAKTGTALKTAELLQVQQNGRILGNTVADSKCPALPAGCQDWNFKKSLRGMMAGRLVATYLGLIKLGKPSQSHDAPIGSRTPAVVLCGSLWVARQWLNSWNLLLWIRHGRAMPIMDCRVLFYLSFFFLLLFFSDYIFIFVHNKFLYLFIFWFLFTL